MSLLCTGILLPQTLAYSQSGAARDHITLSQELAEGLLTYTTGTAELASAGAAAGLAASGWSVAFRGRYSPQTRWLAVSVSAPLGVALCYLLMPGTRISPRFLCFLILPTCCGLGLGVDWLLRGPVGLRLIAALAVVGWGGAVAVEHHSLLTVGRPGLKALAAELRGSPVALMGAQADMNVYYFPDATVLRHDGGGDELRVSISRAQYVIEGRALWDNRLDVTNPELTALGFRKREVLVSCIRGDTEYLVYERSPPTP